MAIKSKNKNNYIITDESDEKNLSILDILVILSKNLKLIFYVPSIICSLMIVNVLFIAKPVYVSTSKIMSSSNPGNIGQTAGFAAQFGINIPFQGKGPNWVYSEIVKSRVLAKAVLERNFDTDEFGPGKSLLQILTYGNDQPNFNRDVLESIAVNKFLNTLNISEDPKTSILTLSVNAKEKNLAYKINQVIIEELDFHQQRYNKSKTSEAKKFIQGRILDTEKELIQAEEELKVFNDRNRRIENSPELQLAQQRFSREVTVLIGVFTSLKQQLENTKIEEVKDSKYVIILDPPNVPIISSEPRKRQLVIASGIFGIILAIVFILFKHFILSAGKNEKAKIQQLKENFLLFFSSYFHWQV